VTGPGGSTASLPIDPTFTPAAYERVTRLLRFGVVGFLVLAVVGLVAQLIVNPSESVATLLASNPTSEYASIGAFFGELASGQPGAVIILGIVVMVAVTIGRVALATVDFLRGRERTLGVLSAAVLVLLLVALFVVGPFVR
jgi:uncharacterized membrane protein